MMGMGFWNRCLDLGILLGSDFSNFGAFFFVFGRREVYMVVSVSMDWSISSGVLIYGDV